MSWDWVLSERGGSSESHFVHPPEFFYYFHKDSDKFQDMGIHMSSSPNSWNMDILSNNCFCKSQNTWVFLMLITVQ